MAASSLAGSVAPPFKRLEMVPHTDFSRSVIGTQFCDSVRAAQLPPDSRASDGSSLRSKARTEAVLRSIGMMEFLVVSERGVDSAIVIAAAVQPLVGAAVGVPEQVLRCVQAVRAYPFAHGIQAFDKAEGRGGVACIGHTAGIVQFAECAVADRDGHHPARTLPAVVLPATVAVVGFGVVMPVDTREREPRIKAAGGWRAWPQCLQALVDQVVACDQGGAGQQ